jgi:thermostable 8-oxoguanine DNA glycosylase
MCPTLDQRILDIIVWNLFSELSALSEISKSETITYYIIYLKKMEELAQAEGYKVDQLALFLFQFGKNLKKNGDNTPKVGGF